MELELGPLPPAGPEVTVEKVDLEKRVELPAVEVTEELERRTTGRGRGRHLPQTVSARF